MTLCGVEVIGEKTDAEKKEEDKDKKTEVEFELTGYDQSSVSEKYEWSAQKLIQY